MPWLMKAEPDTRLEKGVDVKVSLETYRGCNKTKAIRNDCYQFSIDDFEEIGISKWDGELEGLRFCGVTPNCYVRSRGPQSRGQEDNEGKDENWRQGEKLVAGLMGL